MAKQLTPADHNSTDQPNPQSVSRTPETIARAAWALGSLVLIRPKAKSITQP